ncbi:O-succinylhomoserine sulfhydrylase [Enterovirga sp.]|uniref:O-succinylhomoserine sulfhydrylase n=1 Tax=Enterovirga sp. TaxID=2026350 RepID=UPI002CD54F21|nr:O-succinylhomoserine sulfhydrylase [Enterovirga sp.]HMO30946.1 O-succinylhomoserine sulfhydrylase [Enterovirga sp.]
MTTHSSSKLRPETVLVHGGTLRSQFAETSEALFLTQGHVYASAEECEQRFTGDDPGFIYARFSNPTTAMFEARMAALEGAQAARATATGMAAVTAAIVGQVRAGDHVLAARALFGSCRYVIEEFLPRFSVETTLVDGRDLDEWRAGMRANTRTLFLESPTNPSLDLVDIEGVARIARAGGATLVVDNVFATPLFQRPLALGADCVVYSATKHIDGQGRCLGGVVLASADFIETHIHTFLRQTGPAMSPFNAWVLLKSLETLPLRVRQQAANAAHLADALAGRPGVARLVYPGRPDHPQAALAARQMSGGSTLIALELEGGKAAAFRFLNALRIVRISNNLGDAKSLVTHPATTTHQRFTPAQREEMGIGEGLVRLSIGLEHPDDVLDDLLGGLAAARG